MLPEALKFMRRAERAAMNVKNGVEILTLLKTPESRALLLSGVQEGIPPISKIAPSLVQVFAPADLKTVPVKAFIGLSARAVLAEENCERVERGVRTNRETDPLFTTGSVYKQVDSSAFDAKKFKDKGRVHLSALIVAVSADLLSSADRKDLIKCLKALDAVG